MSEAAMTDTGDVLPEGTTGVVADFSADKQAFHVPWGKAMMWFFLLSDTFIFGSFLTGYMSVRMAARDAWPIPSEVFALSFGGDPIPLILIAIMTTCSAACGSGEEPRPAYLPVLMPRVCA